MTIVDMKYDEQKKSWSYQVRDESGMMYMGGNGWVRETSLMA